MLSAAATGEFRANGRVLATATVGAALGSSGAWYYTTGIFYQPVGVAFGVAPSSMALASNHLHPHSHGCFDRARGKAVGITLGGLGVAGFVLPTPLAWIISEGGCRAGYLALGMLTLLVWPLLYLLPIDHLASTRPGTAPIVLPGWEAQRAFRSPVYLGMTAIFVIACVAVTAMFVQLSPIMQSRGLSAVQAASIASLAGLGVVVGRVGVGVLMDRFFPTWIAIWLFCVSAAGVALLLLPSSVAASVADVLLGIALGAEGDMVAFLVVRYFGLRSYASLYAMSYS